MINITLPNYFYFSSLNKHLIKLYTTNKEMFLYNINFLAQEGSLPFHYWGGATFNNIGFVDYEGMNDCAKKTQNNLEVIFDVSNPLLIDSDLNNSALEILLMLNQNGSNKILVANPSVLKKIKNKFPYYKFIGSEYFLQFDNNIEDLERIRLNPLNYKEYLSKIPLNKIELPIYSTCNNCSQVNECYVKAWNSILSYSQKAEFINCPQLKEFIFKPDAIKNIPIKNFYFDIKNIKITNVNAMAYIYIETLIKPEYKDIASKILIKE